MKSKLKNIVDALPYSEPFLFVDQLFSVSETEIEGAYTFKKDEYFYKGHFKDNPITPGVILIECMAQIGLVCLGIFISSEGKLTNQKIVMSSTEIDFYLPVKVGDTVRVHGIKEYFRFQKLKCKVVMRNVAGELICKGKISGMLVPNSNEV